MSAASLWPKHRGLARAVASDYFLPGADHQDVEQEALIGLWIAARTFDPDRGPFPPYARLVIRRRLDALVRAALRGKHRVLTEAARDDIELVGGPEPDRVVIARDLLARLATAVASLTDLEREALALAVNGEPYAHSKRLDNAVWSGRAKLRKAAA